MIRNSFIFLEKIGEQSEKNIWRQGINSWNEFLDSKSVAGMSNERKEKYNHSLNEAKKRLFLEDHEFFGEKVPFEHQWRLFENFKENAVFLDIETSGYYGDITVVGLFDGFETKTMVRGFNLDKHILQKELAKYKMIISFNGASFDLPVIKRYFSISPKVPHIDLRFACQKIGLTGGLKSIEKQLGIKRAKEVEEVSGQEAVYLWQRWKSTGEREHLDKLVKYNEEDIVNLKPLADFAINKLWEQTRKI